MVSVASRGRGQVERCERTGIPQLRCAAEAVRGGVVLLILLGNQLAVQPGRGVTVHLVVKGLRVEHLARLLSDRLLNVVVLHGQPGQVALVAWDHAGLLSRRQLSTNLKKERLTWEISISLELVR